MEDEEVAESWEEAADSGEIDRRLEKKLKITQKESRKSKSPPKVPIVIQDDSLPAGPPPQIRILKRPTTNGVLSNPNSASRPAFPVKSLAQREAEYAEARKRILGSASPEEEQEKPILDSMGLGYSVERNEASSLVFGCVPRPREHRVTIVPWQ
ncbi:SUZ RNA-binding domain-containing isoform 1-T1 [Cariama cristata]